MSYFAGGVLRLVWWLELDEARNGVSVGSGELDSFNETGDGKVPCPLFFVFCPRLLRGAEAGARARARATEKFGKDSAQLGSAVPGSGVAVSGRSSVRNSFTMDPTTDDDAQSTYCVVPVESFST